MRPQRIYSNAFIGQFPGHTQHTLTHPEFRHRVGDVRRKPLLLHIQWRRNVQYVGVIRFQKVGQAFARQHECSTHVDTKHQIEPAHFSLCGRRQ